MRVLTIIFVILLLAASCRHEEEEELGRVPMSGTGMMDTTGGGTGGGSGGGDGGNGGSGEESNGGGPGAPVTPPATPPDPTPDPAPNPAPGPAPDEPMPGPLPDPMPGPSPAEIQALTGADPPAETAADQIARADGILVRLLSLHVARMYGETTSPALPTFALEPTCSITTCRFTERRLGFDYSVHLSDLRFESGNVQPIGTKRDITLIEESLQGDDGTYYRTLGAWMTHSSFSVELRKFAIGDARVEARFGRAGGARSTTRPAANATWRGLMVGTPATGIDRGDRLQGDAELTYDMGRQTLDATFTNIKNIDRLGDHSISSVGFSGVSVDPGGEFAAGERGNRIQGGFFGSNHQEEAAGVFERMDIIGAFGAKRP